MKCPYCKTEANNGELFCTTCGQAISGKAQDITSTQVYWEDYQRKTDKEILYDRERTARTKKEHRKARNIRLTCAIICCTIVCAIVILILSKNMTNKRVLDAVHEQMIGQVYYDTEDSILWSGDDTDRCIITILNQDQLEFKEANYKMRLDSDQNITWSENTVYRNEIHEYTLSISFGGKVSITIQGQAYEVEIWEDGTVRTIHIYDD